MELFTVVDDAIAIVRFPKGIHKQVKVYRRGGSLYVPQAGGFVRIVAAAFGGRWSTDHPDIKVIEIEGDGIKIEGNLLLVS